MNGADCRINGRRGLYKAQLLCRHQRCAGSRSIFVVVPQLRVVYSMMLAVQVGTVRLTAAATKNRCEMVVVFWIGWWQKPSLIIVRVPRVFSCSIRNMVWCRARMCNMAS